MWQVHWDAKPQKHGTVEKEKPRAPCNTNMVILIVIKRPRAPYNTIMVMLIVSKTGPLSGVEVRIALADMASF